ncbi:terminase small subunit [Sporosarcina saromensis]|uniref:Terminase small subunit n=1 Tax=Sporosarcina saromensis TaxID=359365 RepID=A0ABU4G5C3_9BACL|nr:terminase small subunit [Sporosarcina saromensis]MDW0112170.1 terminase small subunit [Sporosarcina saromensis]
MTKNTKGKKSKQNGEEYKLTSGQRAFIEHYLISENAQESYYRAYPKSNLNTAGVNGHKLLKMDKIQKEIAKRKAELKNARHVASAEDILMRLTTLAFDPDVRHSEQLKALELLGKNQALWIDRQEIHSTTDFQINLTGFQDDKKIIEHQATEYIEHEED